MMRSLLVVPVLVGALIAGAATAQGEKPKEFKPAKGGFSVRMPGTPKSQVNEGVTIHTAQKDSVLYIVGHGDYPEATIKAKGADGVLDADRDSFARSVNGKVVSEKKETLDGNPGRNIRISTDSGAHFQVREFLVGRRLFQVVTGGAKEALESQAARDFHASFKLVK